MNHLHNTIRRIAESVLNTHPVARRGIVSSINPALMQAKVDVPTAFGFKTTGWLPLASQSIGAGWGIIACPPIGSQCLVMPMEGDGNSSVVWGGHWSLSQQPPSGFAAGEIWLVHQTGAKLTLSNAGAALMQDQAGASVTTDGTGKTILNDASGMSMSLGNNGTLTISGGNVVCTGTVYSPNFVTT